MLKKQMLKSLLQFIVRKLCPKVMFGNHKLCVLITSWQLDDAQSQLQTEMDSREVLEGKTRQLQGELSSLQNVERSYAKLEKSKKKLEDDLYSYKVNGGMVINLVKSKSEYIENKLIHSS